MGSDVETLRFSSDWEEGVSLRNYIWLQIIMTLKSRGLVVSCESKPRGGQSRLVQHTETSSVTQGASLYAFPSLVYDSGLYSDKMAAIAPGIACLYIIGQ